MMSRQAGSTITISQSYGQHVPEAFNPVCGGVAMSEYAALIGIDWADQKHDICLIDPATGRREASVLLHSAKSLDEWALALRERFGGRPIAVCLEQARGPLIYALMKYDFLTLYPINPST